MPYHFAIVALRNYTALTGSPYGLSCESCPRQKRCDVWPSEGTGYRHEGARLFGKDWTVCPTSTLNTPHMRAAMALYNAAQVSALDGWPVKWSAWVVDYITEIHEAIDACKRSAVEG